MRKHPPFSNPGYAPEQWYVNVLARDCIHVCSETINFVLVYNSMGYMDVVANAAEASMNLAVHEIKDLPGYSDNGEVSLMYM